MKHKTAIKQLMSMGVSRNYAKHYLYTMRIWTNMSNMDAVEFYKIYGDKWAYALGSLAADAFSDQWRAEVSDDNEGE